MKASGQGGSCKGVARDDELCSGILGFNIRGLGTFGGLELHCWSLDQALIKGLEVEESTQNNRVFGVCVLHLLYKHFAKKKVNCIISILFGIEGRCTHSEADWGTS